MGCTVAFSVRLCQACARGLALGQLEPRLYLVATPPPIVGRAPESERPRNPQGESLS